MINELENNDAQTQDTSIATKSQWQLIRGRFVRHRLAVIAFFFVQILYLIAIFADFFSPYTAQLQDIGYSYCPPQIPKFSFKNGLYVYPVELFTDPLTFRKSYHENRNGIIKLSLFAEGPKYKFFGLFECNRHLIGIKKAGTDKNIIGEATRFYLLGADKYGRDILSRIIYGARISLSVGVISIIITFLFGVTVGGISGYIGGAIDNFIQRTIEIINSIPKLPLWLAFSAVLPDDWSSLRIYFSITLLLSLLGWTGLARVVRGKLLSLREEDYAVAAYLLGASHKRIIFKHLLPGFTSHIIVSLTMTVPWMILGETSLSFLGLGLRPPIVSWGVMLQDCMNMTTVANYPWLLLPVVFIIFTVLCFNFMGDGLRDASDPYSAG
ncbi:MAG: ABC transporter permease [Phycisphaerae bacterium]|nr:ABC transporter permease [Phycisphaerae bacterium]